MKLPKPAHNHKRVHRRSVLAVSAFAVFGLGGAVAVGEAGATLDVGDAEVLREQMGGHGGRRGRRCRHRCRSAVLRVFGQIDGRPTPKRRPYEMLASVLRLVRV